MELNQYEDGGVDGDGQEGDFGQPVANGANVGGGSEEIPGEIKGANEKQEIVERQSGYGFQRANSDGKVANEV